MLKPLVCLKGLSVFSLIIDQIWLQEEIEGLILRLAASFTNRKDQLLFLINNYDVIMSIINERTKDDTKESEGFREQLRVRSEELAEQVLHQYCW